MRYVIKICDLESSYHFDYQVLTVMNRNLVPVC